ncbi:MAG: glutamate racemase [Fimbriimonadaceae bacterium]|nr:glutamate racemase [Alphaproteobacteria bacterium]
MNAREYNKKEPAAGPILVFDSGLGGLTVLRQITARMPGTRVVYCADNGGFPYGNWDESALVARIVRLMDVLVERVRPAGLVIACNTATTIALEALRAAFTETGPRIPVVGTVPAIKVAAKESKSRVFSVLATPGTVKRDYTKALMAVFAGDCDVTLVGVEQLAAIAERKMWGDTVDLDVLAKLIAPAFKEVGGRRTDTIVLGCTHYPLIEHELALAAPWPVRFIDPAPAIARRVVDVMAGENCELGTEKSCEIIFTADGVDISRMPDHEIYGFNTQTILSFPS